MYSRVFAALSNVSDISSHYIKSVNKRLIVQCKELR